MAVPSTRQRSFLKDLQQLYRKIDTSTDGQAAIESMDDMSVRVSLQPRTGLNAHATFYITIRCTQDYPAQVPNVTFDTPIYHPNIALIGGYICLNLLSDWNACYNLLDIVKALLYLIENPNFESKYDESSVLTMTARFLAGLPVNGTRFAPNRSWCEWALANSCLPTGEEEDKNYIWTPPETGGTEAQNLGRSSPNEDEEDLGRSISEVGWSISSGTIPSFAKIRNPLDDGIDELSTVYCQDVLDIENALHRIILWQPIFGEENTECKTLFYYAELLPHSDHYNELGASYQDLFMGSTTYDAQVDREFRQTCRNCEWSSFYVRSCTIDWDSEPSVLQFIHLDRLFSCPEPKRKGFLTDDFCPWAKLDHRGKDEILAGLFFFEERPRNEEFRCFLDKDDDDDESDRMGDLFNSCANTSYNFNDADTTDDTDFEFESDIEELDDQLEIQGSPSFVPEKIEDENQLDADVQDADNEIYDIPLIRQCYTCNWDVNLAEPTINMDLCAGWSWIFHQTRWPFRFAPQQTVKLTTEGVYIPPWRASAGLLLHDVCRVCSNCPQAKNIVLLDPLALSPFSPILNLMQRSNKPESCLAGILWMTPFQALSPFFRVPIPTNPSIVESDEVDYLVETVDAEKVISYPAALFLRFLALNAYFTNWVSWLSRSEVYSSMGTSRISSLFITDTMAARVLQTFSLGCGQAPLAGLWPLWIIRHCMKFVLRLPQMADILLHRMRSNEQASDLLYFFPFSDLDEI